MKNSSQKQHIAARDGAAPILVVMVLFGVSLVVLAAYLSTSLVQQRANSRATYFGEARNAAEGVAEYALAEVTRRAFAFSTLTTNPLSGYVLEPSDLNFLAPQNPITFVNTDPLAHVVQSSLQYRCGNLSPRPSGPIVLSAVDPVYRGTLDAGQTMSVRTFYLYAKASVKDGTGQLRTAYVKQAISVREQSWLNYAVFYNMDMEFHSGPDFTIRGPVHTNGDAYVAAGSGKFFKAYATFSAQGKILRELKYNKTLSFGGSNINGAVSFISNGTGTEAALKTMAEADDSNRSGWYDYSKARWNKNLQDGAYGVPAFAPDGMPTYTPENFATGTVELRNDAWLLIEPQLSTTVASIVPMVDVDLCSYPKGRYGQKRAKDVAGNPDPNAPENIKLSALAGFTIKVQPILAVGDIPKWKLCFPVATDNTNPVSKENLPRRNADGTPIVVTFDPFGFDETDGQPLAQQQIKEALKVRLRQVITFVKYRDGGTAGAVWGVGGTNPVNATTSRLVKWQDDLTAHGGGLEENYAIYDRREGYSLTANRQMGLKGAFHLLRIDMNRLNALIRDDVAAAAGLWRRPSDGTDCRPQRCWSGVVYVELPHAGFTASRFPPATTDGDMIRPAQGPFYPAAGVVPEMPGYAVALVNAKVLPRMIQDLSRRSDGFSIATNGPLYIVGDYNADGNAGTGSDSAPDTVSLVPTATSEIPSLIAADAVTVLSSTWITNANAFRDSVTAKQDASDFTEVSSAIITGLVPTRPNATDPIWSGGVHNLVRYLENWGGSIYRYRGSLCAIYESEVAKGFWYQNNFPWYDPPTRQMGFHQFLAQGWFPPGTPIKRTVRRMNLSDIYKTEYDAAIPVDAASL